MGNFNGLDSNFDGSPTEWTPIGKPASAAVTDAARLDNNGVYVDNDGTHADDDATPNKDDGTRIAQDSTRIVSDGTRVASDGTRVYQRRTCRHATSRHT